MADFSMYSGDSKIIQVTLQDASGAAVDVSSPMTIIWQLSKKVTSPALLTKTVGTGIAVTNGPLGKFEITLAPVDTAGLKGDYYQEIEINDSGTISTVLTGTVTINPDAIQV